MTSMVKPRQKQKNSSSAPEKKKQKRDSRDEEEDEDWVVVKKQRVTIIIPPLPTKVLTLMPNVGGDHLQENPTKSDSQLRMKTTSNVQFQSDNRISKEVLDRTTTSQAVCSREALNSYEPNLVSRKKKPSSISHHRTNLNNGHVTLVRARGDQGDIYRKNLIFFDTMGTFRDRRKRAAYLDKKLKRAGGLENWLASLGLTCFVEIFRRRNVNKFQLANINMKKLKDMGLDAVGPRRKLMHAIDCFCQPHCFNRG